MWIMGRPLTAVFLNLRSHSHRSSFGNINRYAPGFTHPARSPLGARRHRRAGRLPPRLRSGDGLGGLAVPQRRQGRSLLHRADLFLQIPGLRLGRAMAWRLDVLPLLRPRRARALHRARAVLPALHRALRLGLHLLLPNRPGPVPESLLPDLPGFDADDSGAGPPRPLARRTAPARPPLLVCASLVAVAIARSGYPGLFLRRCRQAQFRLAARLSPARMAARLRLLPAAAERSAPRGLGGPAV